MNDIRMDLEESLSLVSTELDLHINDRRFALAMDARDPMAPVRTRFEYPKMKQLPFVDLGKVDAEEDSIYLAGNSLGLMPKAAKEELDQFLKQWSDYGVYGHHYGEHPWYICDEELLPRMARLVGASTDEVAIMNQLTSSLHFMLLTFYRPTQSRYKILFEDKSFPSDYYAFESQALLHGLDPNDALLAVKPRQGEHCLRLEDILQMIRNHGTEISVICFSGTQYYTGQHFNIPAITSCGHQVGAFVGWDLAHSVGNIELDLHEWDVDFAVWTTYKYLNAGAGNTGAAFLHSRLFSSNLPYLSGWWGHDIETRMQMTNIMEPGRGIRKYRMSTPSALHCAALRSALKIFDMVNMKSVRRKSILLTEYLDRLLNSINVEVGENVLQVITPRDKEERGAQLSVSFSGIHLDDIHTFLKENGVVCDQRKPNVIRMAACPLYNSFLDVFRAYEVILSFVSCRSMECSSK